MLLFRVRLSDMKIYTIKRYYTIYTRETISLLSVVALDH